MVDRNEPQVNPLNMALQWILRIICSPASTCALLCSGMQTVLAQPVFTQHLKNVVVNQGDTLTNLVQATGTAPLTFQWWLNGTNIEAAAGAQLVITNIQVTQAGRYSVVVTDANGSRTSVGDISVNTALPDQLNPGMDYDRTSTLSSSVLCLAPMPDGRIMLGGDFRCLGGSDASALARVRRLGVRFDSVDPTFQARIMSTSSDRVKAIHLQPDGMVVVGGIFKTNAINRRSYMARYDARGDLDESFNPDPNGAVNVLVSDGRDRILVGGAFTQIGMESRSGVARLENGGMLDAGFAPVLAGLGEIDAILPLPDGRILLGGTFGYVNGVARTNLARLNADGSLDLTFDPHPNGTVSRLVLQPDGSVLCGGRFTTISDTPLHYLARLDQNGVPDSNFNPTVNSSISALELLVDGRILIGGQFTQVKGQTRTKMARLSPDGTLDSFFIPNPNSVECIAVQQDGTVVVGGALTSIAGQTRRAASRLIRTDTVHDELVVDSTGVFWRREGALPEAWRTTFEISTDSQTWNMLGEGVRVRGGGALPTRPLPTGMAIRARGFITAGSSWYSEALLSTIPLIRAEPPPLLSAFEGANIRFRVETVVAPDLTYQWFLNGVAIARASNPDYVIQASSRQDAGIYTCLVQNPQGRLLTDPCVLKVASGTYTALVLLDRPTTLWRLGESVGTPSNKAPTGTVAYDFVGGFHGYYNNNVTLGNPGHATDDPDTAAYFSGPQFNNAAKNAYVSGIDGIDFSKAGTNAQFSVEAWARQSTNTPDNCIVTLGYGMGGEQFSLDAWDGTPRFFVRLESPKGGALAICWAPNPMGTNWHHLVGVCDLRGGFVRLYVDGTQVASASVSSDNGFVLQAPTAALTIGARKRDYQSIRPDMQFVGDIDDVALYDYALTAEQISAHFQAVARSRIAATYQPATGIALEATGIRNRGYRVEASSDLVNWSSLTTNSAPFWVNDLKLSGPSRFYRTMLVK